MSAAPELAPEAAASPLSAGRRALLLTILIFLTPVAVGTGLYVFGWRPAKTINHGTLIQPPRALAMNELTEDVRRAGAGKWLLLIAGDAPCDAACVALAEQSRAIRVSLNRDMGRLLRIVLADAPSAALTELQARQPDLVVAPTPPSWRPSLQADAPAETRHRFYVVDPAGNLMMQYAPDAEANGVRADLERLLKHSWIG